MYLWKRQITPKSSRGIGSSGVPPKKKRPVGKERGPSWKKTCGNPMPKAGETATKCKIDSHKRLNLLGNVKSDPILKAPREGPEKF